MLLATPRARKKRRKGKKKIKKTEEINRRNIFQVSSQVQFGLAPNDLWGTKKKRHTQKVQVAIDKNTRKIICTFFTKGRKYDFDLFKISALLLSEAIKKLADSGYQGIQHLHKNSQIPKKNRSLKCKSDLFRLTPGARKKQRINPVLN